MPVPRRTRPFGDLEATVMDLLWSAGRPLLVRDVVERMRPDRSPAYTTVMTVHGQPAPQGLVAAQPGRPGMAVRADAEPAGLHRPADARGVGRERRPGRGAGPVRRGDRRRRRRRAGRGAARVGRRVRGAGRGRVRAAGPGES